MIDTTIKTGRGRQTDEREEMSTKQRFVVETYNLLSERGLENLRVRDIAERVGCTAAALYKHFESLDYLVLLASIKFLDGYAEELVPITKYGQDAISIDLQAWKCFNNHAFNNPPIFLHLFWAPNNLSFEDAMSEYMQLFPPRHGLHVDDEAFYGYFYSAMFKGSLQDRDYVWLRRAAGEGLLKLEDAKYISTVNPCIVHSRLIEHLGDYKDPEITAKAIEECDALIEKTITTFLLPKPSKYQR